VKVSTEQNKASAGASVCEVQFIEHFARTSHYICGMQHFISLNLSLPHETLRFQ
jgi:hypothetical protein